MSNLNEMNINQSLINTNTNTSNFDLDQKSGWIGNSPSQQPQSKVNLLNCNCPICSGQAQNGNYNLFGQNSLEQTTSLSASPSIVPQQAITQDYQINTVWSGEQWGTNTITYSFYDNDVPNSYYGSEIVSEVSEQVKNNVRAILKDLEAFIDLKFLEVEDTANNYGVIRYQSSSNPSYAYAYYPSNTDFNQGNYQDIAGDIFLNPNEDTSQNSFNSFQGEKGSYGYMTLIHETLHALGLKHPGNYNGSGLGEGPFLSGAEDNTTNTVMTYNYGGSASTAMLYDIKALQYIYGANKSYNAENTVYSFDTVFGFSDGNRYWGSTTKSNKVTLWDSNGVDTLDFSKLAFNNSGYRFDLQDGGIITTQNAYNSTSYDARGENGIYLTSSFGTVIAYNAIIENLINSTSNDYIIANNAANTFSGYSSTKKTGNDIIVGSNNLDTLDLSSYNVANVTQTVSENNLIIDLGTNGSITIQDYYASNSQINILLDNPTTTTTTTTTTNIRQLGFETSNFSNWETIGDAKIETSQFGTNPTDGEYQGLITSGAGSVTDAQIEQDLGLTTGTLDGLSNKNATEGSAFKLKQITVKAGDVLSFDWNFATNEQTPTNTYNDFAFVSISDGNIFKLADTQSNFVNSSSTFREETGYQSFNYQFTQEGTYTIAVGVMDVTDTLDQYSSALLIDNVMLTKSSSNIRQLGFETNNFSNWETIGDAKIETSQFGTNPTDGEYQGLITSGAGSVTDAQIEQDLGLTTGTLDGLSNKNATEGSAFKLKQITVKAGDVLSFDWNFATNEQTPTNTYNDFAFVSISDGNIFKLADTQSNFVNSSSTFREETGYQSFNYQFTQEGTYTIALGVMDVTDTLDQYSSALLIDNVVLTPGNLTVTV